ncbi:MAG: hypothetical protein IPL47_01855 [Phyllobacteriaceae bacterium]|nr:hypothetical protein [Phyllobacteriaceae bacterium]
MKTVLTLIVGIVIGYGVSMVLPADQLMAKLMNIETPDMSGGHELNTDAGAKPEAPKQ